MLCGVVADAALCGCRCCAVWLQMLCCAVADAMPCGCRCCAVWLLMLCDVYEWCCNSVCV